MIFSCFLREDTEKPMIKISLRSVGTFPCNQLAAEFFGGGGHLNASGGEFYGTMDEARKVFEQALEKYKPLLNAKDKKSSVVKVKSYELSICSFQLSRKSDIFVRNY